jgi:hypothetical protein
MISNFAAYFNRGFYMDIQDKFYLGRIFDPAEDSTTDEPLLYDPGDLTTHAVAVGMTGSGKTGLCIDLLEEAALNGIPALMIDPKGDITNTLLHFPDLLPDDFQPWVNADQARRQGKTIEQAADEASNLWRNGLGEWGIGPDRLRALGNAAQFAIYTPGSDAGIPVSILASLKAPDISWNDNRELLREKISATVTALLGLVGMEDIDPVRSREHILLANIFENAWGQGKDLDLGELIMQTQNPPFEKLGVFDINTFFPEKDRFELAMLLNNILAAPAFQTWIEGQPLDVASLLYGADGRPRHSVFYIAHLPDAERMFFVTLLYSAIETWMRSQTGIRSLRALLYFDEIFGYLPPVSNPPSKQPILRMLKQARAFGVGQVLVTQNPSDVDYKGLSNAGTWFIGKLQTEQDKERLLDGLESAMTGGMDRGEYDRLISTLGKRVFLLHNVHEKRPKLFRTRWAMNYLAGPLTRVQVPALNELVGASSVVSEAVTDVKLGRDVEWPPVAEVEGEPAKAILEMEPSTETSDEEYKIGSTTRPPVPGRVDEFFLPNNLTVSQAAKVAGRSLPQDVRTIGLLYRPVLLAQAEIRFLKRKYNLDYDVRRTALVLDLSRRGTARWEDWLAAPIDPQRLDRGPAPDAYYASLDAPLSNEKTIRSLKADFVDWAYRTSEVQVRANEKLKIYAGPEVSQAEFRKMCTEAAREELEDEAKKVADSFDKKIDRLKDRLQLEERELREDEDDLSQRKMEEWGTHAENILGLFGGRRRRLSSSLSKRRMTGRAKADVEESKEAIEDYQEDINELEREKERALENVQEKWSDIVDDMTEISVAPYKKDVLVEMFGVAWMPHHAFQVGEEIEELPGYGVD